MRKLYIEDMFDLAQKMIENVDDGKDCSAVLFYDDAASLLAELMLVGDVHPVVLEISHPDYDGYDDEYYVDVNAIGDGACELFVTPAKQANGSDYLMSMADVAYVDGEANSSVLKYIDSEEIYELDIQDEVDDEEEDYCDMDCETCPFSDCLDEEEDNIDEIADDLEDEDYRKPLLDLIGDVIEGVLDYINKHETFTTEEILDFISRRFGPYDEDSEWMHSNCYYFASILNERFPGGRIYYDVVVGHFVYEYDGVYFDYSGIIPYSDDFVAWDKFDEYDSYQKERIIRDCIK